jgi:hypothetical protein
MTEHYTKTTEETTKFCNRCGRLTQHAVSGGRVGRCKEHEAPALTKAQSQRREKAEKTRMNPGLFESK